MISRGAFWKLQPPLLSARFALILNYIIPILIIMVQADGVEPPESKDSWFTASTATTYSLYLHIGSSLIKEPYHTSAPQLIIFYNYIITRCSGDVKD